MPSVSVIITTHNRSSLLQQAIESVLHQSFQDYEIIIVDDGSTDDTQKIVEPHLVPGRVCYFFQNNAGVAAARNAGVRLAKGKYVAFLDDDDIWLPEKLEKQHLEAGKLQKPVMVITNGIRNSKPVWDTHADSEFLIDTLEFRAGPPAWFMSKEIFDEGCWFDENFASCEDIDFFVQLMRRGGVTILYLKDILYKSQTLPLRNTLVSTQSIVDRDYFLQKHYQYIRGFPNFCYAFFKTFAKDARRLGLKQKARQCYLKALAAKPWRLEMIGKALLV